MKDCVEKKKLGGGGTGLPQVLSVLNQTLFACSAVCVLCVCLWSSALNHTILFFIGMKAVATCILVFCCKMKPMPVQTSVVFTTVYDHSGAMDTCVPV